MTVNEALALFKFDEWATGRTLEAVSLISEASYREDRKSSHGGIHGTLLHIYRSNRVWLQRWQGSSAPASADSDELHDLRSLRSRWGDYQKAVGAYLSTLDGGKLAAPFAYRDLKGNPHSEPLYQQMQHLINHSSYHRGQVVTMLRQTGAQPAATDLILFYRTTSGLFRDAT